MNKTIFKKGDLVFDQNDHLYTVNDVFTDSGFPGVDFLTLLHKSGDISTYHCPEIFTKPRPIIFSTEMVKAILAGRKTQTRRLIKPQEDGNIAQSDPVLMQYLHDICPYGSPGDILYVRETWATNPKGGYYYAANCCDPKYDKPDGGWKPSIHMPRQAARIFLKIEDVRVERLTDISGENIYKEGIKTEFRNGVNFKMNYENGRMEHLSCTKSFSTLWDSINKDRAPWESNPWVWAITFSKTTNT